MIKTRTGVEVDEFVDLLEEAAPLLGFSLNPLDPGFSDFDCGEWDDGAAGILSMASTAGIRLSDHAMEEIEQIGLEFTKDKSEFFRAQGEYILYHIERIRALDTPTKAAA